MAYVGRVRDIVGRAHTLWYKASRVLLHEERPLDRHDFYASLWERTGRAIGAEVRTVSGDLIEIRVGARAVRTYGELLPLDDPVTLQLAGNKSASAALLHDAGVPTAEHVVVRPGHLAPAAALLARHASVVVKPQAGAGGGTGITTNVRTKRQLRRAVAVAASFGGASVVVEQQVSGRVYRLLYLDGDLLDAVLREPARVVGDGRRSVDALVQLENDRRRGLGDRATALIPTGLDLQTTLAAGGFSGRDVPASGQSVQVSGRSNTGDVADSRSVLASIGPELNAVGARAAAALGVRFAAVEVMSSDISLPLEQAAGVVSEVNTTPGLLWHYLLAADSPRVDVAQIIVRRLLGLPGAETA